MKDIVTYDSSSCKEANLRATFKQLTLPGLAMRHIVNLAIIGPMALVLT